MDAKIATAGHEVLDRFFAAPTSEPLVVERVGDSVVFSRGIPEPRMTITAAALFLGMSRTTFYANYITPRKIRVGNDKRIARKAILSIFSATDGRG